MKEPHLGPFQGKPACVSIEMGKGVVTDLPVVNRLKSRCTGRGEVVCPHEFVV
jgi:hypothetical protein